MLDIRKEILTESWILIQDLEQYVPNVPGVVDNPEEKCLLCPGNEAKTPNEILSYKKKDNEWWLRVIPHKNPKLKVEIELTREGYGMYDTISNTGAHEIIIEYPEHGIHLADIPKENVEKIIWAYRDRIFDLYKDKRIRYALVRRKYLENGNSKMIGHPHSEILATPFNPLHVKLELMRARSYYAQKERCIFCDILRDTLHTKDRVIYENEGILSFAPFAPRYPFETWIIPKVHNSDFTKITGDVVPYLADAMKVTFGKIRKALNNPQFHYNLHTEPNRIIQKGYWETLDRDYHWHFIIVPLLFHGIGYDCMSGIYTNNVLPEKYAQYLRKV